MFKKRVAVHGYETDDKKILMEKLKNSDLFQFENDTDEALFQHVDEGFFSPLSCVTLQILLLNMDGKCPPPRINRHFLGCDLIRPTILILYGALSEKNIQVLEKWQTTVKNADHIQLIYIEKMNDISLENVTSLLQTSGEQPQPEERNLDVPPP